jgi:general stress protein YciG
MAFALQSRPRALLPKKGGIMPRGQTQNQRGHSRRGFAAMDRSEQRRIAAMGGRASHGGRSRPNDDYYEENDNRGRRFSRRGGEMSRGDRGGYESRESDYDEDYDFNEDENNNRGYSARGSDDYDEEQERGGRYGGRGYDRDSDYDERYSARGSDYDEDEDYNDDRGGRGGGRRGFAAMDPEEQRRIAAKGGRASHGGGRGRQGQRSSSRSR